MTDKLMEADIALALIHHRMINDKGDDWARLEMIQFENVRIVRLEVGRWNWKYIEGRVKKVRESKQMTRSYYLIETGEARYFDHVHP